MIEPSGGVELRFDYDFDEDADVELTLERRVTLSTRERRAPERLRARIRIGRPWVGSLNKFVHQLPEGVRVEDWGSWDYWLVNFPCTFLYSATEPFLSAWVRVNLMAPGVPIQPVARDLRPQILLGNQPISRSGTVKASLKFGAGPIEIAPEAEIKRESSVSRMNIFCEALGEGTATPSWAFDRVKSAEIRGQHHLGLIAQSAQNSEILLLIAVGGVVQLRGWLGGLSYAATIPPITVPAERIG